MNEIELSELLQRYEFIATIKTLLLSWANYWGVANVEQLNALSPESYRKQRKLMIRFILNQPDMAAERIARLVIANSDIKALKCYHLVTPAIVKSVVDGLLSSSIALICPEAMAQDESPSGPNVAPAV
nr:MAG TPA: hypothetical protein [Caudoviricetes sp.]